MKCSWLSGSIALAAVLWTGTVHAQEEPLGTLTLEELLDVSVSTPTRRQESAGHAPATIYVVTSEEIERLGLRDLKDVLAIVPGVDAIDPHFFLLGGQRGFVGSFSQTLLLVNGREMNNLIAGETFISNQFRTHNIAQVEIINGPGSALYGANALAGVINIVTKTRTTFDGYEVTASGGSFDTGEAGVVFGSGSGPLNVRGAFSYFRSEGDDFSPFLSNTAVASPAAENNAYRNLPNAFGYENDSSALSLSLDFDYRSLYGGTELYRNDSSRGTSGIQWDYRHGSDHRDLLLQYIGFRLPKAGKVSTRAEYRFYREEFWGDHTETEGPLIDPVSGDEITSGATPGDVERFRGYYSNRSGSGSHRHVALVESDVQLGDRHQLVAGVQYEYSDIAAATFSRVAGIHPPSERRPEYENWKWGIYLQDQISIGERLVATIGARYDEHERYGSSFNPRIGLVYQPDTKSVFKLLYGEAFREPNVFEIQNSFGAIRPSELRTFELAWHRFFGTNLKNEIVIFHNEVDNLIVTDGITPGGISNKGSLDSRGIENVFSFKYGRFRGWVNYTWTRADLDDASGLSRDVLDIPRHKANLALMYDFDFVSAGFVVRHRGEVDTEYHDTIFAIDDYTVADVTLSLDDAPWLQRRRLGVDLITRNLFDRDYYHSEPRAPSVVMHPQDGRSVTLRVTWRSAP